MDGTIAAQDARSLYEADEHAWMLEQLALLQAGRTADLDFAHLAEYLRDVTIGDRRALQSRLARLYQHILKHVAQPERATRSWNLTVVEQQSRIRTRLRGTPSIRRYIPEILPVAYEDARRLAAAETGIAFERFPAEPPMTVDEALTWQPPPPAAPPAQRRRDR